MKKFCLSLIMCFFAFVINVEAVTINVIKYEFQVNQTVIGNQDHATVSMNQLGTFMVTWHDYSGGGDVKGRLFDNLGSSLGNEFLINETIVGDQRVPSVSTNKDNLFVIAWSSEAVTGGYDIYAKITSSSGQVLLPEFKVNTTTSEEKSWPDVDMYANGDFIVTWDQVAQGKKDFYVRFFNALGNSLIGPVRINKISSDILADPGKPYGLPAIAVNNKGNAFAAWERVSGSNITIIGRLFNPYTRKAGKEFIIEPPVSGYIQRRPIIDMNSRGDMAVTWVEALIGNQFGNIYVKKYYASSSQWGTKINPDSRLDSNQHRSVVKLTEKGDFIISWTNNDSNYQNDVYMRVYNADGAPLVNELLVNSTQYASQQRPAIDLFENLNNILLIVTWESNNQDGNGLGIFGKLYEIY